ncbi:MAG: AmmeMemoRadiSam system protein B [Aquabacterium sp.]|nr:AmmeMemoRadiSam system protein B [Aquabacterium sp.]
MTQTRPAAVAGSFYPGDPHALRAALAGHLARVTAPAASAASRAPKMLVVPHAGYVYSGDVAASAYALLAPLRDRIRRVVLLGPTHRVAVRGLAAPAAQAFDTPLGRVPIDQAALARIADLPQVVKSDRPHALEHSLEVQLPFLQAVLGSGFSLVPLAVGEASSQQVDEVLERLWGGDETLVLISSDLSHYLPYAEARARDRATVQRILGFASDLRGDEACGAMPLNGALRTARRHGLQPRLLDLRNSGDTAGDRQRVVGYGAIAFEPAAAPNDSDTDTGTEAKAEPAADPGNSGAALGQALLTGARAAIAEALGLRAPARVDHPRLRQPGASFVTLHDAHGDLRGCIGQLEAWRALGEDVHHNALAAAFGDRRFSPVTAAEVSHLHLEVSVLAPMQAMPASASPEEAAGRLQPGVDGVLLEWRGRRGTFLPQVWAQLPAPADFLRALRQKAGLPPDFWAADLQLWRYQVTPYEEPRDARPH